MADDNENIEVAPAGSDLSDLCELYELAKMSYLKYSAIDIIKSSCTDDEKDLLLSINEFFLSKKQGDLIKNGVF